MFANTNHVSVLLAQFLLDASLRLVPVLAIGLILAWVLRRASSSVRHFLWLTVLVAAVLMPVLSYFLPAWPVLPVTLATPATLATTDRERAYDSETTEVAVVASEITRADSDVPETHAELPTEFGPISLSAGVETPNIVWPQSDESPSWPSIVTWLCCLWALGATVMLLVMARGLWRLRQMLHSVGDAGVPLTQLHASLCRRLRIKRQVQLQIADADVMPMTCGTWRPIVLLPVSAPTWSPSRQRMVLLHELAHVQRFDYACQWLSSVVRAVYWFHPGVWFIARKLHHEREKACDDVVLNFGHRGSDYAAELVEISRGIRVGPKIRAGIAMTRSDRLQSRVSFILNSGADRCRLRLHDAVIITLVSMVVSGSAAVLTVADETAPPQQPPGQSSSDPDDARAEKSEIPAVSRVVQVTDKPEQLMLVAILEKPRPPLREAWLQGREGKKVRVHPGDILKVGRVTAVIEALEGRLIRLTIGRTRHEWKLGASFATVVAAPDAGEDADVKLRTPVKSVAGSRHRIEKGLAFLQAYPALKEFRLKMTEQEFLKITDRHHLVRHRQLPGPTYSVPTDDGHIILVMFGNNGDRCHGIQRIRGTSPAAEATKDLDDKPKRMLQRDDPLDDLIAGLTSTDFSTRMRAVSFLGHQGEKGRPAVPALVTALDNSHMRESALHALKNLGPAAAVAVPDLFRSFTAWPNQPATRWIAADALSRVGDAAVPVVTKGLQSENLYERLWSHAVLAKMEGEDSPHFAVLAKSMLSESAGESLIATRGLTMIGADSRSVIPQIIEAMGMPSTPKTDLAVLLSQMGEDAAPAIPQLVELLNHKDDMTRQRSAYALSRIGGPRIAPAVAGLVRMLTANREFVREMAATTLGTLGPDGEEAIPALIEATKSPEERVRAAGLAALGRIAPAQENVQAVMVAAMSDTSGRVRSSAAPVLAQHAPVNEKMIQLFVNSSDDNWGAVQHACDTFFRRLGPEHKDRIPKKYNGRVSPGR